MNVSSHRTSLRSLRPLLKDGPDDCLEQFGLFTDLSAKEKSVLASHKHVTTYPKGQTIFHEGARPTGLYFVISGRVKVYKKGLWAHEQIVRLASPGDLLTLRAAGGTPHYVASATALEDSEILFVELEDFFSILRSNNALAGKVILLMTQELDQAENRVRNFAQLTVRQRLAHLLLSLRETCGANEVDGSLGIRLTREDLANCIGTASETVVRFLSEFRDEQVLALEGRTIRILDWERLNKVAHPDKNQSLS